MHEEHEKAKKAEPNPEHFWETVDDFSEVLEEERALLAERRERKKNRREVDPTVDEADIPTKADVRTTDTTGLAISGGGVRSAAFSIGVMQGLHEHKIMDQFDYMSTVSGGGYAGGALTWFMSYRQKAESSEQKYSMLDHNFPFHSGRTIPEQGESKGLKFGRENIDFIRQRSSYLEPGAGLTKLSAAAVALRGTIISVTAYIFVFVLFFLLLRWFGNILQFAVSPFSGADASPVFVGIMQLVKGSHWSFFFWVSAAIFLIVLVLWLLYSVFSALPQNRRANGDSPSNFKAEFRAAYRARRALERWGGRVLGIIILFLAFGMLDQAHHHFSEPESLIKAERWAGLLSFLGTIGGFASRFLLNRNRQAGDDAGLITKTLLALLPVLSSLLLIFGFGFIAMEIGHVVYANLSIEVWLGVLAAIAVLLFLSLVLPGWISLILVLAGTLWVAHYHGEWLDSDWPWILPVMASGVLLSVVANINNSGLHRMYRDRLMETFMPNRRSVESDDVGAPSSADHTYLHNMCSPDVDGPFHIVNTNAILVKGRKSRYRSRGGDSFALTPLYSGSEATGWIKSEHWPSQIKNPIAKRINGHLLKPVGRMTLPTAVAISGAALNPRTGADGKGVTKGLALSFVLTVLNLRLGYWIPTPQRALFRQKLSRFYPPNFVLPGLLHGLLGVRHDENSGWLELSDGGHFDNTGLYELIRRRVKTIVLIDGSADPDANFSSFANAAEKALIDFNTRIHFKDDFDEPGRRKKGEDERFSFEGMMRGAGVDKKDPFSIKFDLARRGFAVAQLQYPKEPKPQTGKTITPDEQEFETGYLFYVKTSMVAELPAPLYSYKSAHPAFPDEPTSDQFFSEQQFEAYRILGLFLARQMAQAVSKFPDLAEALDLECTDLDQANWAKAEPFTPSIRTL